jgi:hypothetical protein
MTPDVQENTGYAARPWTFHLFRLSKWSPLLTGIAFGGLVLALMTMLEFATGRPQAVLDGKSLADAGCVYLIGDYRIGIISIMMLTYAMTARYILAGWTRRTAAHLGRADFVDAEVLAETHWWGILPGLAGLALSLATAIDISERDMEWSREYWILPHIFNWLWCIPMGWIGMRLIYALTLNAIRIARLAREIEVRDIYDTTPLDATIRHGTRSALLSLMLLGLVSVNFIDPGLGLPSVVFLVSLFVVGVVISTLPVIGAVQMLYDKRDRHIERLRHELEVEERQLLTNDPDYEPSRIGDIVALERRLEERRVPLFRLSVLVQLIMYAAIGFLSWLGAAAVSAVVEAFFGL